MNMNMMGSEPQLGGEKPDNLLWVEEVLLNNLEDDVLMTPEADKSSLSFNPNVNKLTIAEIEMRDENFFGDDRVRTLSRLISARIRYVLPSSTTTTEASSAGGSSNASSDSAVSENASSSNISRDMESLEKVQFWLMKVPSVLAQERELSRLANTSKREINFYTEMLPSIRLWVDSQYIDTIIQFNVPTCFYGKYLRSNDAAPDMEIIDHILMAESLLVLQDMRELDFGKRYFGEGMTISEVMVTIQEIAKFHAVTYAMQVKSGEKLNWEGLYSPSEMAELYTVLFKRGYTVFNQFISNYNSTDKQSVSPCLTAISAILPQIKNILLELLKPVPESDEEFPNTLIHMDLWSDNILFRTKDEDSEEPDLDCCIIDWQMVSVGRPSHDLAILTLLSMEPEVRRENATIILQYYYQVFEQVLEPFDVPMPFEFTRLVKEYSRSCILAVIMAIASMDVVMLEESTQYRLLAAIQDLISDGLLPSH